MKQVTSSRRAVLHVAVTGVMTGLVMAFTFIGINIGSAYVNLGDAMVLTAAALFGPATAAIAGGLGAMFADLIVFPATFAFTLVIKAVEGAICGALIKYAVPKLARRHIPLQVALGIISMVFAAVVMAVGYFGTNVLFWGEGDSPANRLSGAVLQLPIDMLQGVVGCVLAVLLTYVLRLDKIAARFNVGSVLVHAPLKSADSERDFDNTAPAEKDGSATESQAEAQENLDKTAPAKEDGSYPESQEAEVGGFEPESREKAASKKRENNEEDGDKDGFLSKSS